MTPQSERPDSAGAAVATADLMAALQTLYRERDAHFRQEHGRSLPFADAAVDDRWERARRLGFGEGASIYNSALVIGEVSVGEGTWIGPSVVLEGNGGLTIGSWCSISAGVQIYTHNSVAWALSGGKASYFQAPTRIGSRCYLAPLSVVAAGVTIGEGSLVATHSFVNADVPPATIVGGAPARRLGRVELRDGEPELVFDNPPEKGDPAE